MVSKSATHKKKAIIKKILGLLILTPILIGLYTLLSIYNKGPEKFSKDFKTSTGIDIEDLIYRINTKVDFIKYFHQLKHEIDDHDVIQILVNPSDLDSLITYSKANQKFWIPAQLQAGKINDTVKIKIHGTSPVHFEADNYSLRVKQKKGKLWLGGMKAFNLIKHAEVRSSLIAANYLASIMGLISPCGRTAILQVNEKIIGAYYLVEHLSKDYIKRKIGFEDKCIINHVTAYDSKEADIYGTNHISDLSHFHGHIEANKSTHFPEALKQYKNMVTAYQENDIQLLSTFFDEDYIAKFLAWSAICNDIHPLAGDNLKLIYNPKNKKFYPLFRQEVGFRPLLTTSILHGIEQDLHYSNFNSFLFDYSLINFSKTKTTQIFKSLISNDLIRNKRDIQIQSIIKDSNYLTTTIDSIYKVSNNIRLQTNNSTGSHNYFLKKKHIHHINNIINYIETYFNHSRVFGTYHTKTKILEIELDAYVAIRIVTKEKILGTFNGIQFNAQLKTNTRKIKLQLSPDQLDQLTFTNTITNTIISKDQININRIF